MTIAKNMEFNPGAMSKMTMTWQRKLRFFPVKRRNYWMNN